MNVMELTSGDFVSLWTNLTFLWEKMNMRNGNETELFSAYVLFFYSIDFLKL